MTVLKPKDVAQKFNVTTKTLARWDLSGKLPAYKYPSGRRYYTVHQILTKFDLLNNPQRKSVCYIRAETSRYQKAINKQFVELRKFVKDNNLSIDEYIREYGRADLHRPRWNKMLRQVINNQINVIYVTKKDRFIKKDFDWWNKLCFEFNCEVIVIEDKEN